ncbi:MAG: hypothetical protein J0M04_20420 [Verrucomicrobia bacterium]|nr:hypothetical protein [Verrucomicrobiota bacterium]
MNDSDLDLLLARARDNPPDTSAAELAFETRLMARLREERAGDSGTPLVWRLWLWFAAPAAACVLWAILQPPDLMPVTPAGGNDDLDLASYLTGEML